MRDGASVGGRPDAYYPVVWRFCVGRPRKGATSMLMSLTSLQPTKAVAVDGGLLGLDLL